MRILMLLDAPFPPDVRVEKEASTLVRAGHEVHVLCYRHARKIPSRSSIDGVDVRRRYVPRAPAKKALGFIFHLPLFGWMWQRFILSELRRIRPHALHVHDLPLSLPVLRVRERSGEDAPFFVLDLHENYPELVRGSRLAHAFPQRLFFRLDAWKDLERKACADADALIVVSEANRERMARTYGRTEGVEVIPNTISLRGLEATAAERDVKGVFSTERKNLLYVGGMDESRDLETVLDGLAMIPSALRPVLVMLGDGSLRGRLQDRAASLGLQRDVRWVGWAPQSDVHGYCIQADVCILPLALTAHTDQTDPNKLYQYAFAGRPVLAAGTTVLKLRVAEMGCGRTYPPGDAGALARVLTEMLSDEGALARMGASGRESVETRFNWEATSGPLVRLYEELSRRQTAHAPSTP